MSDLVQRTRGNRQAVEPIQATLEKQAEGLSMALAGRIGTDRFIRAAVTSFRTSPALQRCSRDSILGGLFVAAQLGLEVGGPRGLAYLVPYGKDAQLVLGYKGMIDLLYRAGARSVQWFLVRDGDQFQIGSDAVRGLVYEWHPADLDESRPYTGAVAQVIIANGGIVWDYMTRGQIEARRPAKWKGTPHETWPEEMAVKTVLRHLSKRVPMSTELALAADSDETVQRRVEVPGMPAEQLTEHVPLAGTRPAVEQRPTVPPHPPVPGAPPHPPVPGAPRPHSSDEAPADVPAEPEPAPEPADDDWEAREREEHAAWLAAQQEPI